MSAPLGRSAAPSGTAGVAAMAALGRAVRRTSGVTVQELVFIRGINYLVTTEDGREVWRDYNTRLLVEKPGTPPQAPGPSSVVRVWTHHRPTQEGVG